MSKKDEYITCHALIDKQVVDIRGILIGKVSDVAFNLKKTEIIIKVTTKANEIMNITSSDIQSAEDLILLNKEIQLDDIPSLEPLIKEIFI